MVSYTDSNGNQHVILASGTHYVASASGATYTRVPSS
jgi:hypothetical protein